jgi:hypothetical protein
MHGVVSIPLRWFPVLAAPPPGQRRGTERPSGLRRDELTSACRLNPLPVADRRHRLPERTWPPLSTGWFNTESCP